MASSDFARHYSRNHYCFLFLWVLRCFTSPRSLPTPYFIQVQVTRHDSCWVTPFGNPRINASLPTPQGISQAGTSFIGSRCQGIHHVPLPTCQTNPQHNKQTHPTGASVHRLASSYQHELYIKTQNITIIANYHTTNTHTTCECLLASTIQESRIKKPNQRPPGHNPGRRLMPQTPNSVPYILRRSFACLRPLVNTPNRSPTFADCHEVCSLERR